MIDLAPFALADRQVAFDSKATERIPELFERKRRRLAPSPHAFFRGSARLYASILEARPDLAEGPPGDGWIVGDMHLENVGAYRTDEDAVVFDLNDFDEAVIGPLRADVLRLATSILLAGRGFRASGGQSIALASRAVSAYLGARAGAPAPPPPGRVTKLIERARARSRKELLDARAPSLHGRRRFERGERYLDLPFDVERRLPAIVAAHVKALGPRAPAKAGEWTIEDAALRIAGNGSLGVLRVAVLLRDRSGDERILEFKQVREPSGAGFVTAPADPIAHPAERVVAAARALCKAPPRHLAAVRLDELSLVGRRLSPQEDALDLDEGWRAGDKLDELVQFVGRLLGAAHARGTAAIGASPPRPWMGEEVEALIDRAVELAGIFEAVYLAYARKNA